MGKLDRCAEAAFYMKVDVNETGDKGFSLTVDGRFSQNGSGLGIAGVEDFAFMNCDIFNKPFLKKDIIDAGMSKKQINSHGHIFSFRVKRLSSENLWNYENL
jgi:hypothetical protein